MTVKWTLPNAGRVYAYIGQIGGFALSFWANIRDAYIPEIPDGVAGADWREGYPGYKELDPTIFDLVTAGFFPVAVFVAIELLARVAWKDTWPHRILRWAGVGSLTAVALIVSYSHLRTGFLLAGWNPEMASLAPAAIDGFMVLCTVVLLMTGHPAVAHEDLGQPAQVSHQLNPGHPAQVMAHTPVLGVAQPSAASVVGHPEPAPEPTAGHPEMGQVAHEETAGQTVAHEVAQVSDESNVQVAQDEVAQVAHEPDEPVAQKVAQPKPRATRKPAQRATSGRPTTDPAKVAQAVAAVRAGMAQRAAATKFGVSRATLQRAMDADKPVAQTEPDVDRAAEEALQGVDLDAELAEILGHKNDDET
jgi:hypothetical protein